MSRRKRRARQSLHGNVSSAAGPRLPFGPNLANDLSVDAYALMNHLTLDSKIHFTSSRLTSVFPLGQPVSDTGPHGLTEDSSLTLLHSLTSLPSPTLATETFRVTQDSRDLVDAATHANDDARKVADLLRASICTSDTKVTRLGLGLNQPFVLTDNEYDCRDLARCIAKKHAAIQKVEDFPRERLDDNNDQGLSFPDGTYSRIDTLTSMVRNENFDISRQTFDFMIRQHRAGQPQSLLSNATNNRRVSRHLVSLDPRF